MIKKKKIVIFAIIVIVVIAVFYFARGNKQDSVYTTAEVTRKALSQTVSVTGDVVPKERYDLSFKLGGMIKYITEVGSVVVSGEQIAGLDKDSLRLQILQAQKDIEYQQRLYANMRRNEDTYEKEQRAAQRVLVEKAQLAKSLANQSYSDADIYSPIDGTIVQKNFLPGEYAGPGSAVISVATSELIIESNIPESDIAKISVGQSAEVTFDAFSDEELFEAEVFEVEPSATVIQDVVYYKTKLKLSKSDERFKPGMSVSIDIRTAEKSNVLTVPSRAIKTEDGKKYVEVLQEIDNTTKKIFVETGMEGDEGLVEIKSGLNGGEKVVTFVQAK